MFELSILRVVLIPWPIAYHAFGLESFGRQLRMPFVFSLSWLVSTELVSQRLALAQLTAPAAEDAT